MTHQEIIKFLDDQQINYDSYDHRPVYTVEDMIDVGMDQHGILGKNLFLRDQKGTRHFLILMPGQKAADLAALSSKIGSTKLSFASDKRLKKYLDAQKGSVSPFAILHDEEKMVEVVIDKELVNQPKVGFHPNSNEVTLFVHMDDIVEMIKAHGNDLMYVEI